MLEDLFGNPILEKILFYLLVNEKCYPSELKNVFQKPRMEQEINLYE